MEDGRIAAEKTTVTIHPRTQQIEIIQEDLFAFIKSEKETEFIIERWDKLLNWKERKTAWAKELDHFPVKNFVLLPLEKTIQPHLTLTYSDEKELEAMGVWFNKENNQFSINQTPQNSIKTNDGSLSGNYWVFNGDSSFSFTLEPFLHMSADNQKLKYPLYELLQENNKAELKPKKTTINHNENKRFNTRAVLQAGKTIVFNNATLYTSADLSKTTGSCQLGDSITILEQVSFYISDEYEELQLLRPLYKVRYNGKEAFLKGSDLPIKQVIVGGTQFIMGTESNDGKLMLKVYQNNELIEKIELMDRAYKVNVYQTDYDLFKFQLNTINNQDFKNLLFFNFADENNGSDGWLRNRTYSWNGTTFKEVRTNEAIHNLLEYELVFPSDKNGLKDTLTYKATTGYMSESGDYEALETQLFYFAIVGGELQQVSKK